MNALACHRRFVYRSLLIISVCYLLFQESALAQHVWGYASRTLREFAANHWHLRFEWQSNCNSCRSTSQAQATTGECSSEPYNGVPTPIPGKIEAEEYDQTGCAYGSYVPYEPKPDDPEIVYNYPEVLAIDPNAPDKEEKVATVGGEWLEYTINVTVASEYRFAARVASAVDGERFHVEIDGVNRTGSIIIPNTGSWDSYQMVEADLGYLEAGRHVMRLVIEGNSEKSGHFDYYLLTLPTPPCTDNDGDGYCSDVDCDDWDP